MFQDYLEVAEDKNIQDRIIDCIIEAGSSCSKTHLLKELSIQPEELDAIMKELIKSGEISAPPVLKGKDAWFELNNPRQRNDKQKFVVSYIKNLDSDEAGDLLLRVAEGKDVSNFDEYKTKRYIYNRLMSKTSLKEIKEFLDIDEE